MNKKQIRLETRERRRQLNPAQQQRAANDLAAQVCKLPNFLTAKRIALYLANDGEIDPMPTLLLAQAAGKKCLLPILHPLKHNRLYFAPYRSGDPLRDSYFGYPEPPLKSSTLVAPWAIDIILLPLVAFDKNGNRLGMGGGFYDRTLSHTRFNPRRPLLVGIAHQCQQLDSIPADSWDFPLDWIATDQQLIKCQ